jgi:hypothetical protein
LIFWLVELPQEYSSVWMGTHLENLENNHSPWWTNKPFGTLCGAYGGTPRGCKWLLSLPWSFPIVFPGTWAFVNLGNARKHDEYGVSMSEVPK